MATDQECEMVIAQTVYFCWLNNVFW